MTHDKLQSLVLTRDETASSLDVSTPTLRTWRLRGFLLPLVDSNGRTIGYSRKEVENFKRKQMPVFLRRKPGPKTTNPRIRPRKKESSV